MGRRERKKWRETESMEDREVTIRERENERKTEIQ